MKKEGFNPRIITKNIFKLSPEELDSKNYLLENELKMKKIGNKENKVKINQIKKVSNLSRMKIQSSYKSENKDDNIGLYKNKMSKRLNISPPSKSPFNNTLISHREEANSLNKNNNKGISLNNLNNFFTNSLNNNNTDRSHSNICGNTKISSYKNKLNSTLISTSNIEIKATKTTKNLVPLNKYEDTESSIKRIVSHLKLCQKNHLPDEKNYFVSEKNLKLIEMALSDKESDIDNLKMLLNLTKNDIDNFQNKYDGLNRIIQELIDEKEKILVDYENLYQEHKEVKENYDDYSFQYNKIVIFFKRIENLVSYTFKLVDSFKEVLLVDENQTNNTITISKKSKFYNLFLQIDNQIMESDSEIRAFVSLFTSNKDNIDLKKSNSMFLLSPINKDYLKIEKMNKNLKNKLYDYENLIKKLSHIYETKDKGLALTDIAKDYIEMKKRLTDIFNLNENLEKENEYLRISYHNIYNELFNEGKNDKEKLLKFELEIENYQITQNNLKNLNDQLVEHNLVIEKQNSEHLQNLKNLKDTFEKLNKQNLTLKCEYDKNLDDNIAKEKMINDFKVNEFKVLIANLQQEIINKEDIINQLKMRIIEYENEKSFSNKVLDNDRFKDKDYSLETYLNKSDDNILYYEDKNLKKKVMKYEIEIKYLKDKLKEKEDEYKFENFESKTKMNFNSNDLIYHIYNQAKIIENIN